MHRAGTRSEYIVSPTAIVMTTSVMMIPTGYLWSDTVSGHMLSCLRTWHATAQTRVRIALCCFKCFQIFIFQRFLLGENCRKLGSHCVCPGGHVDNGHRQECDRLPAITYMACYINLMEAPVFQLLGFVVTMVIDPFWPNNCRCLS